MKSMTGYGEATQNIPNGKVTVQIRSVNHRHLDLQVRAPREFLSLEEDIRKMVRQKIFRGRIDIFVNRYAVKGQSRKLEMDEALVGQYIAGVSHLKKKFKLAGEIGVSIVATIPDVFQVREVEIDATRERLAVTKALTAALRKLEQSRQREGAQLCADMQLQVHHLRAIASGLDARAAENGARPQKSTAAPESAGGERHDKELPEMANVMFKGDINEELVRLKTHLVALGKALGEREPVGKRIDFMLQEVNRELNTISSKVPYLPVTQLVLQGKERVEKIREQTQNIE